MLWQLIIWMQLFVVPAHGTSDFEHISDKELPLQTIKVSFTFRNVTGVCSVLYEYVPKRYLRTKRSQNIQMLLQMPERYIVETLYIILTCTSILKRSKRRRKLHTCLTYLVNIHARETR